MKPRVLFASALLLAIACVVWVLWPREPAYAGKSLSAWLALYDSSTPEEQLAAAEAVRGMGQSALPALLKMLQVTDSKMADWIRNMVARQSFVEIDITPAYVKRMGAQRALETLGPVARPALPRLAAMLRAGKDDADIAEILAAIGAPSVEPLMEAVTTVTNRFVRASAIAALGWLGSNAQPAVPLLLQFAQDTNDLVFGSAIRALGDIGERREQILPLLTNMLWTDVTSIDAGYALWGMNRESLLPLTIAVTNENRRISGAAAAALVLTHLQNTGKLIVTRADRRRCSSLYNMKVMSSFYLHRVPARPELLPALERNAQSNDPDLRTASAAALTAVSNWISEARSEAKVNASPLRRRR